MLTLGRGFKYLSALFAQRAIVKARLTGRWQRTESSFLATLTAHVHKMDTTERIAYRRVFATIVREFRRQSRSDQDE